MFRIKASNLVSLPLLLFIVTSHQFTVNGFVSRRAKCSIECYKKCANSGTPMAVYCNCPLSIENDQCTFVTEQLLTDKTVERLIESESGYKDIRTIWLKVAPVPGAFIYIFEFSIQQSSDRPIWTFAGASSSPQITFAVPDACRDYQFRTIVVLRSTDTAHQLTVFRPKAIPRKFPAFIVPKESIHLDRPKQSDDHRTVHISVKWQNPFGYDDADVYGYSPPTAYPIRCQTVNDQLAPPRLELVQGGAKMHLALPAEVLRGQCRLYMEVRMLPRCVRIDPFDVKISLELDCKRFTELPFCQKENGPKCTDIVDLWGKDNGHVILVWQRPPAPGGHHSTTKPLFYTVNWGNTQTSQGHRWIVHSLEQKVPGNHTTLELSDIRPGTQYGLQICAFFSDVPIQPEAFRDGTEPLILFNCLPCRHQNNANLSKNCIDCSKIERPKEPFIQTIATANSQHNLPFSLSPQQSVHIISSDSAVLDVFAVNALAAGVTNTATMAQKVPKWDGVEDEGGTNGQTNRQSHSKTHKTQMPLELTKVEKATTNGSAAAEKLTTMEQQKNSEVRTSEEKKIRRLHEEERMINEEKINGEQMKVNKWKDKEEERKAEEKKENKTIEESGRKKTAEGQEEEAMRKEEGMDETTKTEEWEGRRRGKEEGMDETTKTEEWEGRRRGKEEGMDETTKTEEWEGRRRGKEEGMDETTKTEEWEGKRRGNGHTKSNGNETSNSTPNKLPNQHHQQTTSIRIGEQRDQSKSVGVFTFFDGHRWLMFAVPALLLFCLFVSLALLLLLVVCRRNGTNRRNNIRKQSNLLQNSRKCMSKMRYATGQSVLAARTIAIGGRFASGNGPIAFVGSPSIGEMMASANDSSPSSVSSVDSRRLGGTPGTVPRQRELERERTLPSVTDGVDGIGTPPPSTFNHFADNTARFFMRFPSPIGGRAFLGASKNVHF